MTEQMSNPGNRKKVTDTFTVSQISQSSHHLGCKKVWKKGSNTSHRSDVFGSRVWWVGPRQEGQSQLLTITHSSSSTTQKCFVHYTFVLSPLLFLHRRSLNTDNIRHTPTPSFLRIIPYLGGNHTDITARHAPGSRVVFWRSFLFRDLLVYYESLKRDIKTKPINECRCDERLKTRI